MFRFVYLKPFPLLCALVVLGGCSEYAFHGKAPIADSQAPETTVEEPEAPQDVSLPQPPVGQVLAPVEPCAEDVLHTKLFDIEFPERDGCGWDQGENLGPVDSYIRAVESDSVSIQLGPDEVLCDLRVEFSTEEGGLSFPLQYDDQLLFSFNDRVVFSSDERLVDEFRVDANGLPVFDWLAIRDMEMWFNNTTPWAVGTGYTLELPGHATAGDAVIAIDPVAISGLASAAEESSEVVMSLHALGDNDPTDCGHTGMSFWIELDIGTRE